MKNFIIAIVCGVFESFWRRLFGGWKVKPKFLTERWFQHTINCIFLFILFSAKFYNLISNRTYLILSCVYMAALLEIQFWTRAHGAEFDEGRGDPDDPATIARYEKQWFNHYLLTPIYNFFGWQKYRFTYDFISMMFRYTFPCIWLFPFYGWKIFWIGLLVSPVYAFCWSCWEHDTKKYFATDMAEYAVGAIVGFGLYWIEPCGFALNYLK